MQFFAGEQGWIEGFEMYGLTLYILYEMHLDVALLGCRKALAALGEPFLSSFTRIGFEIHSQVPYF